MCNITLSPFYRVVVYRLVQTCVETGYEEFCCGLVNKSYNNVYALRWIFHERQRFLVLIFKVVQPPCAFRLILIIVSILMMLC